MVRTTLLELVLFVLFGTSIQAIAYDFPGEQSPSVENLHQNWIDWADKLKRFLPRKVVCIEASRILREMGYDKETLMSWELGEDFTCVEIQRSPEEVSYQGTGANFCRILQPKYYAILNRLSAKSRWLFKSAVPPYSESNSAHVLERLYTIPGDIELRSTALHDIYEITEVRRTTSQVRLRYLVKIPRIETIGEGGEATIDRFEVTFDSTHNWLPIQVDRHFEGDFWYCLDYSDWSNVDELPYPTSVFYYENVDRSGSPYTTCRQIQLLKASVDEVKERCQLSYYGLPEIDMRTRNSAWLAYVAGAVAFVGVLAYFIKRSRAV